MSAYISTGRGLEPRLRGTVSTRPQGSDAASCDVAEVTARVK